ncbi:MAG: DUF2203 domain-containing protein [Dehalococcoidia bacterium]|nr:DUF2203 domain-containing protein [Dehalococcoidia bacterium]
MRLYTVEEARTLVPHVIPILEGLRAAFVELRMLQAAVESQRRGASGDGNLLVDPFAGGDRENRLETLNGALRRAAGELGRLGIELKDPERGLIDFYHERDGEVVFLCFELGEQTVDYWHPTHTGYAGRQPIDG